MKQYILEYDAKRIASGLADNDIRDVNLWGHEGPPSITVAWEQLNEEMAVIEKLQILEEKYKPTLLPELRTILTKMSLRVICKRYSILGHEKYLHEVMQMCEGNPRIVKKYNKSIQDTKGNIHLLKNWITDALELNRQICYIMSEINNTSHLHECSNLCDLQEQANVRLLLNPHLIADKVNLNFIHIWLNNVQLNDFIYAKKLE